jgi:hypothetical protein
VVQALAAMEDSPESKTRISRMKKEIIEDLKQSIQMLQRQRGADAAMLSQTPHAMQENASNAKAREILGEKVKARVDQIMVLAGSLHGNQDVQKYEYYLKEGYGSDDLKVKKRKSDEYKQNKKQNSRASMTREELIQDIEKEEFRLTQKVNHIKAENQRAGGGALPPQLAADLDQTLSFLEILKEKKQEILKGKNIETEPVGDAREAMMLEKQLQGAVSQLRTANNLLRQKGQVLRVEWDRLQAQKRLLEQKSAP